jgi:hypothetical protein
MTTLARAIVRQLKLVNLHCFNPHRDTDAKILGAIIDGENKRIHRNRIIKTLRVPRRRRMICN